MSQKATATTATLAPNYSGEVIALRHWEKPTVSVRYVAPVVDAKNKARDLSAQLDVAITRWNSEVSAAVRLQRTTDSEADITVSFVDANTLPDGAIGRTEVMFRTEDQVLEQATIRVDRTLSVALETQVMTHELGHALGIEGHSVDHNDLMYPHAHLPITITSRDRNTLLMSYHALATAPHAVAHVAVVRGGREIYLEKPEEFVSAK